MHRPRGRVTGTFDPLAPPDVYDAVATDVEEPSALTDDGLNTNPTCVAAPAVWDNNAVPNGC